ncbi:MAG: AarF/ABC1/UbiB kinase family protein [Drouetiella hepatica Uher 2000/2452]|jgi:predicted unusual protein kinase regulating ubiquinone biosynthesis (AarF/ABC1/UbiB family)|uniref:AarF/ABC1/UbiB kinase family protein n=1 Tax=Drouetiella hepatica Uher 2000/2452 TaxID=904376 RepID=A0A951Q745_9CYAN|nr:AarF/ABC1/UbiB kinase family protein [Drouetiella hepatica Uher 2000/2452]
MQTLTPPDDLMIDRGVVIESDPHPLPEEHLKSVQMSDRTAALQYDPEAIAAQYRHRFWQVWGRMFGIVWTFLLFAISVLWDRQTGQVETNQQKRAIKVREIVTGLGPAYIKIGQALSTRPDLVPPLYLEELTRLQDQLPPFPNELAFQFIEEELGAPPDQIYAELTAQPIAAASLGQVYKGKLKSGETVAVKVQRPGLADQITLDLFILRRLAAWISNNFTRVRSDLVGIMDEFGTRIFEEMDYNQEGRNAERFAQLYGHLPDIYVPRIYWQYTQRRVLTMEWIVGTKLTQPQEIRDQGIDPTYLIEMGVQCSLRQLLEHGFFHADPHPGNLLVTPDGKLAYLDFGMMSEIKPYQRYGLIEAIVHLVNRDFEGLANDYVKLEFLTPDTDLRPIVPALANVFNQALGATVAELNFKSMTDQLSQLMYDFPFRVPAYYALIIRSLVTLEGIAINVDPTFKVLSKAYPYVAKRLLTDQSDQLRTSLQELLFKDGSFRWNRLENLLRNARDNQDYDINQVVEQTTDFLLSERGAFIREYLVEGVVQGIDASARNAVDQLTQNFWSWFGMNGDRSLVQAPPQPSNLDHIVRILNLLRETPGFDPSQLLPVIPKLLVNSKVQQMGQQIVGGLAQRAAARLIREVLLQDQGGEMRSPESNRIPGQRALPSANR